MDAAQLFKRFVFFVAAGMLVATTGDAADLIASGTTVVVTGSVRSQTVHVTSSDNSAVPFRIHITEKDIPNITWLGTSPPDGGTTTTPADVAIFFTNDLASQGSGPFNGSVALTPTAGGGAGVTINVAYIPGSSTPPNALTVTPTPSNPNYTLQMAYTTNGPLQQQQVIVSGSASYSASASTTDGAQWLQVSTAGQSPGTLISTVPGSQSMIVQIGGAVASLSTATYTGTVSIAGTSGTATIAVVLSVNGATGGTSVLATPSALVFAYQNGGQVNAIPPQTLVITAPAGAVFSASATSDKGWLALGAPAQGDIPGNQQVYAVIPQSGLISGNYTGSITITAGLLQQTVSVQLLVSDAPVLWPTVSSSGAGDVLFSLNGGAATPSSQTVLLTASDRSSPAVALVSVPNFVNVNLTGTTLTITPNLGLTASLYTGAVVVSSNLSNAQVAIPVVVVGNVSSPTGLLTLSQSLLIFQGVVNGVAPNSQTLTVSATTQTMFTASVSNNSPWLSISPSGSLVTSQTLTVSVNPALAAGGAGTYSGSIYLTAGGVTQTVAVTLQLSTLSLGGNVAVDKSALAFTAQAGVTPTAAQTLSVTSIGASVLFTVTTSNSWLKSDTTTKSTAALVNITADPTGLAPGTYSGQVTITSANGTPVNIAVTFTVQAAPTISTSTTSLTFGYRAGGGVPAVQNVQTSGAAFTAQASSDGNWLSVSPATGTSGGAITASVSNLAGLSIGVHSGTITVTGNGASGVVVINVTLNVTAPLPTITAVVNAASYASGSISPGEVITLGGTDLGPDSQVTAQLDSTGKVATQLGGVSVLVNGFPAPLIYVAGTQLSAVVPYEVARFQTVAVQVRYLGQTSNAVSLAVSPTAPGVFTLNSSGSGPGAFNANFSLNGPNNPVSRGGFVTFFLTGEGQTNPLGVTGTINQAKAPAPVANITISIDGQAATYTYAGGVPDVVEGLMQLNVQIPATARSGDLGVVVSIGGVPSQSGVTVSVQ